MLSNERSRGARLTRIARMVVAATAWVFSAPASARGDDVDQWNDNLAQAVVSRPHTVAEIEVGAIALPSAPISRAQRGGNVPYLQIGKGDATVQLGMHLMYRGGPKWAVGAVALFGPNPTSDTGYGLGGTSGLQRAHSRDYLFIGGEARYIPLHYKLFEGWIGAQTGAIIIADRFSTTNAGAYSPTLGPPQVDEHTAGLSAGLQLGISYSFSESFVVGFTLRGDGWFLPSRPDCSAIGDCATLTSSALVYEGGFLFGYRIPL